MNICEETEEMTEAPAAIPGHLYKDKEWGEVHFAASIEDGSGFVTKLFHLSDGCRWDDLGDDTDWSQFTDVTDQYCLKRVK